MNEIRLMEIDEYIINACGSSSEVERNTQGKDKIYHFYQWLDRMFSGLAYEKVKGTQRVMKICMNDNYYLCCLSYRDMSDRTANSFTIAKESASRVWDESQQEYIEDSWWIVLIQIESGEILSVEICSEKAINKYDEDKTDKIITYHKRTTASPYYSCNYSKLNEDMKQDFTEWLTKRGASYVQ